MSQIGERRRAEIFLRVSSVDSNSNLSAQRRGLTLIGGRLGRVCIHLRLSNNFQPHHNILKLTRQKRNFQFENLELEELELEFSGSDKTGENQNKTFKQKLTFESFSLTMKYVFLPRAKPQQGWPPA